MLYVPSVTSPFLVQIGPDAGAARGNLQSARAGGPSEHRRPAAREAALQPGDRVRSEPGTIAWQIPMGDGPRFHPL